jgi:hypothetical protein
MDPFPNCGEMTALRHAHEVGALGSCEIMAMNGDTLVNGDFEWLISYFHEWPISLCVNGVPTGVKIIFPAPLHRKYLPIMVDGSGYFTFLDIGTPEGYVMAKELLS